MCQLSAPQSSGELGNKIGISARAVNYRIHQALPWLEANGISIQIKTNSGIRIQASEENKKRLLGNLDHLLYFSKEKRFFLIIFHFLTAEKPLTLSFFENQFSISRSTTVKEVNSAKLWLKKYNVNLFSKPNCGYWIDGSEADIREAIYKCMVKGADEFKQQDELMEFCFSGKTKKGQYHSFVGEIQDYFGEVNFYHLNTVLNTILDIHLSDRSNYHLILRLAILITRIKKDKKIKVICPGLGDIKQKNEYYWVEFVAKRLGKYYGFSLELEEVSYLIKYFIEAQSSRPIENETMNLKEYEDSCKDLVEAIEYFLSQISKRLHPSLILDSELKLNLVLHLKNIYYRTDFDFPEENPIIKEIKEEYPRIYYLVSQSINESKISFLSEYPEELGYLTIHIATALEKLHYQRKNNKTILLVCNTGAASAILLRTKIQAEFPDIKIESVISYKELLKRKHFSGIDFIISTIPFQLISAPPVLVVDVLFRERDIDNLNKAFFTESNTSGPLPKLSISDGPPLCKLITENMIELKGEAANWEQATEMAGFILQRENIVEARYIQSMKEVIHEFGPFMVAWPGVALLHAAYSSGAKKLGMSLLTLKNPVKFGHKENDPIDIVIALSIPCDCSIPLALDQLNNILLNDSAKRCIRTASNAKAVINQIHLFSNTTILEK